MQWAKEVWTATSRVPIEGGRDMTLPELRQAWEEAADRSPKRWQQVRGPLGALHLSLARLGWSMQNAFCMTDDMGVTRSLVTSSPGLISSCLKLSWRRMLERRAAAKFQLEPGSRVWLGHVASVLNNNKSDLSMLQKGSIISLVTQSLWTKDRLDRANYEVVEAKCELCNEGRDPDTQAEPVPRHPGAQAATAGWG